MIITISPLLKIFQGTQSSNPHNDYCQHFVDTGQRPQNFIRDVGLADRFEEYPKLRELIKLKDELIAITATPPMYLKCDLKVCYLNIFFIEPNAAFTLDRQVTFAYLSKVESYPV